MRKRKSTMVELVEELEKLLAVETIPQIKAGLEHMIVEAKAGEYHDYKNKKYTCGKMASSHLLRQMGFIGLAKAIENGDYDEEADEEDKALLKKHALEGGFSEDQCKTLFGI